MKSIQLTPIERVMARIELDRAWRKVLLGLLGSPVVAWGWASTCSWAREFDAGRLNPWDGSPSPGWIAYDLAWIALYATFGMAGLHVTFGVLVVGALALGAWGLAEQRALHRRLGPDVISELNLAKVLAASPEVNARYEARVARSRRGLVREGGGG